MEPERPCWCARCAASSCSGVAGAGCGSSVMVPRVRAPLRSTCSNTVTASLVTRTAHNLHSFSDNVSGVRIFKRYLHLTIIVDTLVKVMKICVRYLHLHVLAPLLPPPAALAPPLGGVGAAVLHRARPRPRPAPAGGGPRPRGCRARPPLRSATLRQEPCNQTPPCQAVSCDRSDLVNVEYFVHQTVVFLGDAFPIENFIGIVSPAVTTCKWSTLHCKALHWRASTPCCLCQNIICKINRIVVTEGRHCICTALYCTVPWCRVRDGWRGLGPFSPPELNVQNLPEVINTLSVMCD